jgi:hypothetical protein
MTPFQQYWFNAAKRFGLRVQIPFEIAVGSERLTVPVLLEEFGAQRGMLLVTRYEDMAPFADRLVNAGFGYSCLDESPTADLDEPLIVAILRDWGWSGSGDPPAWYTD